MKSPIQIQVVYLTKRGAGKIKFICYNELENELKKLCRRKIPATAKHNGDNIGGVWFQNNIWLWAYENNLNEKGE